MDFVDEVRTRSGRFAGRVKHWESETPTEEATKTSLILPFIQMLGYDIFDPTEVVPEFTADIGIKRGEKVDYAIMQRGKPAILIECKKYGSNLAEDAVSQLVRYFGVTNAHFGILTDGISYRFFSDLDQPNVMDPKPFFEFNMLSCSDKAVEELKRFTKEEFNVDETLEAAAVLKYIEGMKQALVRQLSTPDEEFSRWLTKQVYSKLLTQAARERFSHLVRQAFREFIDDRINATLKSALARDTIIDEPTPEVVAPEDTAQPVALEPDPVVTTEEEVQGYELVKAIVSDVVDLDRVFFRDTKSYSMVLLDNNNRKPILRLYFNSLSNKQIGLPGEGRDSYGRREVPAYSIESVEEITGYADQIRDVVRRYLKEDGDPRELA
jgi:hypothetical protein